MIKGLTLSVIFQFNISMEYEVVSNQIELTF